MPITIYQPFSNNNHSTLHCTVDKKKTDLEGVLLHYLCWLNNNPNPNPNLLIQVLGGGY